MQEFLDDADDTAANCVKESNCDDTTTGHRLRNYVVKCRTGLKGGMANYRKHQEELKQRREMTPTRTPERMRDSSGRTEGGGRRTEERPNGTDVDLSWAYEAGAGRDLSQKAIAARVTASPVNPVESRFCSIRSLRAAASIGSNQPAYGKARSSRSMLPQSIAPQVATTRPWTRKKRMTKRRVGRAKTM